MVKKRFLIVFLLIIFVFVFSLRILAIDCCRDNDKYCVSPPPTNCNNVENCELWCSLSACCLANCQTTLGKDCPDTTKFLPELLQCALEPEYYEEFSALKDCVRGCCINTNTNSCTQNKFYKDCSGSGLYFIENSQGNCPSPCPPNLVTIQGKIDPQSIQPGNAKVFVGGRESVMGSDHRYNIQLPSGTYTLIARARGWRPVIETVTIPSTGLTKDILFTQIATTGELNGKVYDITNNQAIPNAAIFSEMSTTYTNSEGKYTIYVNPLQNLNLHIEANGYQPRDIPNVVISGGLPDTLDIALSPGISNCGNNKKDTGEECDPTASGNDAKCTYQRQYGTPYQINCPNNCQCPDVCQELTGVECVPFYFQCKDSYGSGRILVEGCDLGTQKEACCASSDVLYQIPQCSNAVVTTEFPDPEHKICKCGSEYINTTIKRGYCCFNTDNNRYQYQENPCYQIGLVQGTITEQGTTKKISNVEVRLAKGNYDQDIVPPKKTDSNGYYKFENVPLASQTDTITFIVTPPIEYIPQRLQKQVSPQPVLTQNFALAKNDLKCKTLMAAPVVSKQIEYGKSEFKLKMSAECAIREYRIERKQAGNWITIDTITGNFNPNQQVTSNTLTQDFDDLTYYYKVTAFVSGSVLKNSTEFIMIFNKDCKDKVENQQFCSNNYPSNCNGAFNINQVNYTSVAPCDPPLICYVDYGESREEDVAFCLDTRFNCENIGTWIGSYYNVFGTFYDEQKCLLNQSTKVPNYCFYDYRDIPTQKCIRCDPEQNCFSYISENACLTNNCGYSEGKCKFYYFDNYKDLSAGFCYIENYQGTDYCDLCGKNLFENVECNKEVCRKFGNCFPNDEKTSCGTCEDMVCNDFSNQDDCTGGQNFQIQKLQNCPTGETQTISNNICGIERCSWINNAYCRKDGDSNSAPDCTDSVCDSDLKAPSTTMLNKPSINKETELTFSVNDPDSSKTETYLCVQQASASSKCCPNEKLTDLKIKPAVLFSTTLGETQGYYDFRFYSKDENKNYELIKKETLYVDTKAPSITVTYERVNNSYNPTTSDVILTIRVNEDSVCTDKPNNLGSQKLKDTIILANTPKQVVFTNVEDGTYEYEITCKDLYNNQNTTISEINIDRIQVIINKYPGPDAYNNPELVMKIETKGSQILFCTYKQSEPKTESQYYNKEILFHNYGKGSPKQNDRIYYAAQASNNYLNRTFNTPGDYYFDIYCYEDTNSNSQLDPGDNKKDHANIYFTMDMAQQGPPLTTPKYYDPMKGPQDLSSTISYNSPYLYFMCEDDIYPRHTKNFGCDKTKYCVSTQECLPNIETLPNSPTQERVALQNGLNYLCYYSIDKGGNQEENSCVTLLGDNSGCDVTLTTKGTFYELSEIKGTYSEPIKLDVTIIQGTSRRFLKHDQYDITYDDSRGIWTGHLSTSNPQKQLFIGENRIILNAEDYAGNSCTNNDANNIIRIDRQGPKISNISIRDDMGNKNIVEYGHNLTINATIIDINYTYFDYPANSVNATAIITCSVPCNFYKEFPLTWIGGTTFKADYNPQKIGKIYDLLSRQYILKIRAKDVFGNQNEKNVSFIVKDSSPPNFTINITNGVLNSRLLLKSVTTGNLYYVRLLSDEPVIIKSFMYKVRNITGNDPLDSLRTGPLTLISAEGQNTSFLYRLVIPNNDLYNKMYGNNSLFLLNAENYGGLSSSNILEGKYFELDTFGGNTPIIHYPSTIRSNSENMITYSSLYMSFYTQPKDGPINAIFNISNIIQPLNLVTQTMPYEEKINSTQFSAAQKYAVQLTTLSGDYTSSFKANNYLEFDSSSLKRATDERYKIIASAYNQTTKTTSILIEPPLEKAITKGTVASAYKNRAPYGWFDLSKNLLDGKHIFTIYNEDSFKNKGENLTFNLTIDGQPPIITSVFPLNNSKIGNKKIRISANMYDYSSGIDISKTTLFINGVPQRCGTTLNCTKISNNFVHISYYATFQNGLQKLRIETKDLVGHYANYSWQFIVDDQLPQMPSLNVSLSKYYEPIHYTRAQDINFEFTFNSSYIINVTNMYYVTTTQHSLSWIKINDYKFKTTISGLIENNENPPYEIWISAQKKQGNVFGDVATYGFYFVVDRTPPIIKLNKIRDTNTPTAFVSGNYTDYNMDQRNQILLYGQNITQTYANMKDYYYELKTGLFDKYIQFNINPQIQQYVLTLNARAEDKAGNTKTETKSFNYDRIPPNIAITDVTNRNIFRLDNSDEYRTIETLVNVSGTFSEDANIIKLVVENDNNEIPLIINKQTRTFTALNVPLNIGQGNEEIEFLITARALDEAGNMKQYTAHVFYDKNPPVITFISPEYTNNPTPEILIQTDEEAECTVTYTDYMERERKETMIRNYKNHTRVLQQLPYENNAITTVPLFFECTDMFGRKSTLLKNIFIDKTAVEIRNITLSVKAYYVTKTSDYNYNFTLFGSNISKIIAHGNKPIDCRYSFVDVSFYDMPYSFSSPGTYQVDKSTNNLQFTNNQFKDFYIGCRDMAGNIAPTVFVRIYTNINLPLKIIDLYPTKYVKTLKPTISAKTYRPAICKLNFTGVDTNPAAAWSVQHSRFKKENALMKVGYNQEEQYYLYEANVSSKEGTTWVPLKNNTLYNFTISCIPINNNIVGAREKFSFIATSKLSGPKVLCITFLDYCINLP